MKAASQKEGFTPLQKAKSMGAPPLPPSGRAPTIEEMLEWTNLRELPKAVDLQPLYDLVDMREEIYISRLREAVGIRGVSAWVDHRPKIVEMIEWTKAWAEKLGCSEARLVENPKKGEDDTLPPMLLVTFDCETQIPNEQVRTVCAYGHLDVQPAKKADGWDTEPFELTETDDGRLCGRGASDDKGPALSWLWAVEAHRKLGLKLPVRLKLLYEGMEEYGSVGIPEFIASEARPPAKRVDAKKQEVTLDFKDAGWLADVDHFVVSDNQWLSKTTPCLTYGLRGMAYFECVVEGGKSDLHSGVYGGSVHEPLNDLIHLLGTLRAPPKAGGLHHERIRVPGLLDAVPPVTDEERATYKDLDFDVETYHREDVSPGCALEGATKEQVLMARWRFPTLSIHGVEGAFADPGAKTVLPRRVAGKFSIRLVPDMDPESTGRLVKAHLEDQWKNVVGSKYPLKVEMIHGGPAWVSKTENPNYVAAARAVERVFGKKPDLTREGGSIPIANWLESATKINVVLLPTSASNDGAHAQNEKWDRTNLRNAPKILATYLHEIAKLVGPRPALCKCDPPTEEELRTPGAFAFAKGFRCRCEI